MREQILRVIFGQQNVIDEALIALLAGGHALLIGVPGLAKTRLVETLGTVFELSEKRGQFTPNLMPADIIGTEVIDERHAAASRGALSTKLRRDQARGHLDQLTLSP